MSASATAPHSRLQRIATLDRLATAATWVFWFFAVLTTLQVILALTRSGVLFGPTLNSQPGPMPRVWVIIAPPLLQHAGSVLIHSGLAPGVQASWNGAILGTAHPTAGQALAFAVTLLPAGLLRVDPLIDSGSPKPPQFAYLNTCDLASKHHALKGAGMYVEHGRSLVAVKQRLDS